MININKLVFTNVSYGSFNIKQPKTGVQYNYFTSINLSEVNEQKYKQLNLRVP